jgi:transposase InsO family protein
VAEAVEQAILDHGLAHLCHGALRVANELALRGIQVSSTGVRGVWSRHGLLSRHDRLLRLEKASAERTVQLSDEQVEALGRFSPEFRERHIEAHYSGDLLAVDTFVVSHLKGVGKIYLQSAIDCCSRLAWGRLYTNKMPVTAVHLLNTDVLPTFEAHGIPIKTVLSDNGREFCGRPDRHPYELFLQLEGIEHRKTRVKRRSPTASSSASIAPCSTSTSVSKAAAPGSKPSRRCRSLSTPTSLPTTPSDLIRAAA